MLCRRCLSKGWSCSTRLRCFRLSGPAACGGKRERSYPGERTWRWRSWRSSRQRRRSAKKSGSSHHRDRGLALAAVAEWAVEAGQAERPTGGFLPKTSQPCQDFGPKANFKKQQVKARPGASLHRLHRPARGFLEGSGDLERLPSLVAPAPVEPALQPLGFNPAPRHRDERFYAPPQDQKRCRVVISV